MEHPIIPSCEATGPDGARIVIRPHAATDSVADLARALDLPAATTLTIDDRPAAPHERLLSTGLRVGSVLATAPSSRIDRATTTDGANVTVDVAVVTGPACQRWITLTAGRYTVGRSVTATVHVGDPMVELHHGVLDIGVDASVRFTQLTGAFPATIDGLPCRPAQPIEPGRALCFGASRLVTRRTHCGPSTGTGSIVASDHDPWRSVVRRGPTSSVEASSEPLAVPEPPGVHRAPPLTTLVGAGVAAVGAGLLAAVLGQMLFAVFAAVGAVASVATWAVGALIARRDRRRDRAAHRAALATFEQALVAAHADAEHAHRARHRDVVEALDVVHGGGVWARRCTGSDAMWVTVGRGTSRWTPPLPADARDRLAADLLVTLDRCERLVDVAVPVALEPGAVVAVHGPVATSSALCRSVIVQLASAYGPADWELCVVTNDPDRWGWVEWLPHARRRPSVIAAADGAALADAMERTGAAPGVGPTRRTVVVLDAPALLSARTAPVRRRLERADVTCLVLVEVDATVPAVADRVLAVSDTAVARWVETDGSGWTSTEREILVAGVSAATAEAVARRLAPLIDPEDHAESAGAPAEVSLAELEPVGPDASAVVARRWTHAGRDPAPVARLGTSSDGIIEVDLVRDGPHGLVAGTTGSGKSELLRTLVVSLAANASPDHVTMILVDFKGGSTFDACARLPHTVGVVTDLDDGLAERVLVSLDAEVRRRERLLRDARVDDLASFRRTVDDPLPRLVVIVDEFSSLAKELPDFLGALVAIAQRGRSLGIHLLLATQRPAGVVTDDIRANTNLRIALRLQDRTDADDVVGDPAPAHFPAGTPGRAVLRLGPDELVVFQTASTADALPRRAGRLLVEPASCVTARTHGADGSPPARGPSVLEHLVEAIGAAALMVGAAPPHRPWIDALPAVVHRRDLGDACAIGLLDDPAGQRRRPLGWDPGDGNLLLVGAVGSGTTTAAVAVAAGCVRSTPPGALHLYVVDAHGDVAWLPFEALAQCGAVVRVSETERIVRLLRRLADELDDRVGDGRRTPAIVVVVDGVAAVRDTLDGVAHTESSMRLERVVRDGPAVGITAVVTTDGSSSKGLATVRSATWVFHVADQGIARAAGLRAPPVPPGVPGRLRVAESGLEAQVVFDPDPVDDAPACDPRGGECGPGPLPVLVLPELVDADALGADAVADRHSKVEQSPGQPAELLIGLGSDDLEPAVLHLPAGDHVFIGGASRTGRSTALRQVEAAWRDTHPDGTVHRVDGGRTMRELPAVDDDGCPLLIVVDDAERVDDPDGRLASFIARPGVTVAVAARLEAVRVAYGHWTREVARSRCGLIMTSMGDIDGELLGTTLPRRLPIPARPGLAWIVDQRGHRLVQVAARMPP